MPGAGFPRATACPCGSGTTYDVCCGRLHRGAALADSPEELMRSRYSAFAVENLDYIFASWHPRTRPPTIEPDPALEWTGLEILDVTASEVEFVASYLRAGVPGQRHERSTFEKRGRRWVYVGEVTS